MPKKRSANLVGLIACMVVAVAAPPLGGVVTVIFLHRAFEGTAQVGASQKATVLANGISEAMNGTAGGLVVSLLATVVAAVFAVRLVRERRVAGG